jgi:hypothetical protein
MRLYKVLIREGKYIALYGEDEEIGEFDTYHDAFRAIESDMKRRGIPFQKIGHSHGFVNDYAQFKKRYGIR